MVTIEEKMISTIPFSAHSINLEFVHRFVSSLFDRRRASGARGKQSRIIFSMFLFWFAEFSIWWKEPPKWTRRFVLFIWLSLDCPRSWYVNHAIDCRHRYFLFNWFSCWERAQDRYRAASVTLGLSASDQRVFSSSDRCETEKSRHSPVQKVDFISRSQ